MTKYVIFYGILLNLLIIVQLIPRSIIHLHFYKRPLSRTKDYHSMKALYPIGLELAIIEISTLDSTTLIFQKLILLSKQDRRYSDPKARNG